MKLSESPVDSVLRRVYNRRRMSGFEEVEHVADLALRVRGRDLADLLVNAARGLTWLLSPAEQEVGPAQDRVSGEQVHRVEVEAFDAEGLLVEWLSELLYLAERERFVGRTFSILEVTPTRMRATVRGAPVEKLARHIKAVTYHQLAIVQTAEGLETVIVFDV
jgi:SHS2 domain-containing protein